MIKKFRIREKVNRHNEKRIVIKMTVCLIDLIVIAILFICSYRLYEKKQTILPWDSVESTEEYTYIEVSKMSERFAYFPETKTQIHFVIEKEATGKWHTYLIAIKEEDYQKYKEIIDYTYERSNQIPQSIKVYGYPVIIKEDLKALAIKNITNFVPAENEIVITNENFESYLTNSYLDTTIDRKDTFDLTLCLTLFLLFMMIALLIVTIFDHDRMIDNIEERIDESSKKMKKWRKKR